jgi:hypothetical protein
VRGAPPHLPSSRPLCVCACMRVRVGGDGQRIAARPASVEGVYIGGQRVMGRPWATCAGELCARSLLPPKFSRGRRCPLCGAGLTQSPFTACGLSRSPNRLIGSHASHTQTRQSSKQTQVGMHKLLCGPDCAVSPTTHLCLSCDMICTFCPMSRFLLHT